MSELPVIESRTRRVVAYLSHNRDQLVVDAAVVLVWMIVSAALFRQFGFPQWSHYVVLFVGLYAYARTSPDWERPYRTKE